MEALFDAMPVGLVTLDAHGRVTAVNPEACRLLDASADRLVGRRLREALPGPLADDLDRACDRAGRDGPVQDLAHLPPPHDLWLEVRVWPGPARLSLYLLDITARRAAEQEAAADAERLRLLAEVSAVLAETLDADEAMAALAALAVPALADWCVVTLAEEGSLRDVGLAHRDPERLPDVQAYADVQVARMTTAAPIHVVLSTGAPVVAPRIRPEVVEAIFPDPVARGLLARLDPTSGTAVPLTARGRTVGVLGLWSTGSRPAHGPAQVATAVEIGRRAGLAVDNAQLYAGQRRMSETLQRGLLGTAPIPSDLRVAVRYRPAARQAQVGGDWYDAFPTADGATCLVAGDVAGHDHRAAALMGQVRNLLRGLARCPGSGPADVLAALDRALGELAVDGLATAVLALVDPTTAANGPGRRLRWSNAGHPPPLLVGADGSVRLLSADVDLLLGLDPTTRRGTHEHLLAPGETVLLYTDGLVERRHATIDDGLDWLVEAAGELAALSPDDLCDGLLAQLGGDVEDDVALLAVRLT